jgi:hypothetical protein
MDPPMMKWWMAVAVVVTVVRIADAAETGHPLTIDLQMRNDARVPAHVLEQSQDEVTRIFAMPDWQCGGPRRHPIHRAHHPAGNGYATALSPVMGVAIRRANGSCAGVFRQVQTSPVLPG